MPANKGHVHPKIDLLRAHGRREHIEHPRLDCPACRKFADRTYRARVAAAEARGRNAR
jgi:hypothetical protein